MIDLLSEFRNIEKKFIEAEIAAGEAAILAIDDAMEGAKNE